MKKLLAVSFIALFAVSAANADVASVTYVQNELSTKQNAITTDNKLDVAKISGLATVATSGSYNDLSNKPTIPTVPTNVSAFNNDAGYITSASIPAQVQADWTATEGNGVILNKPTLATVATSGSYNDLSDKPTIDSTLSDSSTNAVQNKVVKAALDGKQPVLTEAQLAAVNSGVTEAVVSQVSTNTTNIANLDITVDGHTTSISNLNAKVGSGALPSTINDTVVTNIVGAINALKAKTDSMATGDSVVEWQAPSAGNNYTWYRKYKSGWVEQGGRVQLNGAISATNKRVNFPVTMADTMYIAVAAANANVGSPALVGWESTTGMSVGTSSDSDTGTTTWYVAGMAAN